MQAMTFRTGKGETERQGYLVDSGRRDQSLILSCLSVPHCLAIFSGGVQAHSLQPKHTI